MIQHNHSHIFCTANSERKFPKNWITQSKVDVTDDFIQYAGPLIGNKWVNVPLVNRIQKYAKLKEIFAERIFPEYIPQGYRE